MFKGIVINTKMTKTAVVFVSKKVQHKVYVKYVEKKVKLFIHDPNSVCSVNDVVLVKKSRPFSKKKHWIFVRKCN